MGVEAYTGSQNRKYFAVLSVFIIMSEYSRGGISTNTAESYFVLLKRGVHGSFHHVSKQHLSGYCDEFSFRWNYRKVNDGTRTEFAIKGIDGKRLVYK